MRIAGNIPFADRRPNRMSPVFAQRRHALVGRLRGVRRRRRQERRSSARARSCGSTPDGYLPDDVSGIELTGFNESWWLGLEQPAHAVRARAQPALRRAPGALPRLERRARLPDGAADRLRADRQDPHGRVDAGDPRHRGDRRRPQDQLERPAGQRLAHPAGHLADRQPRRVGHPEDHAGPSRRAVLADRGLRHRLPDASAAARRLPLRRPPDRGSRSADRGFLDIQGAMADDELRALRPARTRCTPSASSHPGAITLHNYPRSLQKFERNGELIDLSVVDLVRTRRRGVPRYNDFRAGLHKPRIRRWEELCDEPGVGAPDAGDLPQRRRGRHHGRACSPRRRRRASGSRDTAFRIFILMASRRLQSDRFLTVDFRPGDLLAVRHGLDRQQRHDQRDPAPLPGARRRAAPHGERLRAVAAGRRQPAEQPGRAGADHDRRRPSWAMPGSTPSRERPLLDIDLAPPHAPGEPRQLHRGRLDELDIVRAARRR